VARIFLNYRAVDEPYGVQMLNRELSQHFGTDAVFLASKSIELGTDWEREMFDAVRNSVALLAVMGPRWLDARRKDGTRCLDDPADFVRREILFALEHGRKVVPVRFDIDPVKPEQVPAELRPAMAKQGIRVRFRSAHVDIAHLATKLRHEIPELAALGAAKPHGGTIIQAHSVGRVTTFAGDIHVSGDFVAGDKST